MTDSNKKIEVVKNRKDIIVLDLNNLENEKLSEIIYENKVKKIQKNYSSYNNKKSFNNSNTNLTFAVNVSQCLKYFINIQKSLYPDKSSNNDSINYNEITNKSKLDEVDVNNNNLIIFEDGKLYL